MPRKVFPNTTVRFKYNHHPACKRWCGLAESMEYDEEYCFKCCVEYGTNEPCPVCDCSYYEFIDDEEWWDEEDEEV
jgi:hypothetical protein